VELGDKGALAAVGRLRAGWCDFLVVTAVNGQWERLSELLSLWGGRRPSRGVPVYVDAVRPLGGQWSGWVRWLGAWDGDVSGLEPMDDGTTRRIPCRVKAER
jgi:hypothetical protein